MFLILELRDTFLFWALSKWLCYIFLFFFFLQLHASQWLFSFAWSKKGKKTSAEVSSSETITFHKTSSSSLLDLTTTTWNNWINLLLLWIPNWIEKVKFKIQLVLEIKLTHYLSSLGACPGEPYHTHLKWPTLLVATMDVSSRTKIQRSLKNYRLSPIVRYCSLKNPAFRLVYRLFKKVRKPLILSYQSKNSTYESKR